MSTLESGSLGVGATPSAAVQLESVRINSSCFCSSLDSTALMAALAGELGDLELVRLVEERCPYLFSSRPIFISKSQAEKIEAVVVAVESVVRLPAYREMVLSNGPSIARKDASGVRSVFFGYDFHPFGEDLGLIEVNTNAGGALLNAAMARAHRTCCLNDAQMSEAMRSGAAFEDAIIHMFQAEWTAAKGTAQLKTVAIVDSAPREQYLYPEFLLFQRLFAKHGIDAVVVDPTELTYQNGKLGCGAKEIDLVYNRLTDFMLETAATRALHDAYMDNAVVITPHPQAHALYANKRNLAIFCNPEILKSLGASQEVINLLVANVPFTESVTFEKAERLWSERRSLFFKPVAGYGGKAAYRGDKLTKRVWQEVLDGDYIAQRVVAPGVRVAGTVDNPETLKFDLRSYVYDSQVQFTAARVYQGQTTNFRTPGGGFAPVYVLEDERVAAELTAITDAVGARNCCVSQGGNC